MSKEGMWCSFCGSTERRSVQTRTIGCVAGASTGINHKKQKPYSRINGGISHETQKTSGRTKYLT